MENKLIEMDNIVGCKEIEEDLLRYQLLCKKANDIIIFADSDGFIMDANDAALRAFGYEKQEILNKSIFYLVNPDPASPIESQNFFQNTQGLYYEATAYRKDGSTFTAEMSLQSDDIGDGGVLMAILRDITESKLIHEELKQAKDLAEAANNAKTEFLANMSHEIRTPLNGIVGMIDLTLMTELDEEQRDNLYTAKESASILLKLINDILDYSKIEARKLSIESINFNIRDQIKQVIKSHNIRAQEKGLLLKYKIDPKIPDVLTGDPYRLKQVINNILGNAVKFTDFGEVNLFVDLVLQGNEGIELKFQVSDTGIGMTSMEMQKLFQSFSQADSSHTRKYGGTGLGLAISKELVEIMGGSIWAESIKGRGSDFYFTIVFKEGTRLKNSIKMPETILKADEILNILLVEDNMTNQLVMARMIEEIGHNVITASNGVEALDLLQEKKLDIILMDIQMPEMDGIETTRLIREKEKRTGGHIPIIAVTAYALRGDKERFLEAGMDNYISKPISIQDLTRVIGSTKKALFRSYTNEMYAGLKKYYVQDKFKRNISLAGHIQNGKPMVTSIIRSVNGLKTSFQKKNLLAVESYANNIKAFATELNLEDVKNLSFKIALAARRENLDEGLEYFNLMIDEIEKLKDS